jgi:hypothetical protein
MTRSGRWGIAVVVGLVVMAGWWCPNTSEWGHCGAPAVTSALRGLFGKPSALECLGASLDRPVDAPAAPSTVPLVTDFSQPQPSTTPMDPSCTWVVPADRDPLWIYPDGSPC